MATTLLVIDDADYLDTVHSLESQGYEPEWTLEMRMLHLDKTTNVTLRVYDPTRTLFGESIYRRVIIEKG